MANYYKIKESTPSGGDYSEIYYFDDEHNAVDENDATNCIIRECKNDGTVINEIFGVCNQKNHVI